MHSTRALYPLLVASATWLAANCAALLAHPGTDVAINDLSALIASAPDSADLYLRRASCYVDHQRWSEASADLTHAGTIAPEHPDLALARAEYFLARDEPLASISALGSHIASRPDDPAARVIRARAYARNGDPRAALTDFQIALLNIPEPKPELWLEANALIAEPAAALLDLETGIARLGPAPALEERALNLELQLKLTDAAVQRLILLSTHAERPETYHQRRGDILTQAKRPAEARRAYAEALAAIARLPDWLRTSEPTQNLTTQLTALATSSL